MPARSSSTGRRVLLLLAVAAVIGAACTISGLKVSSIFGDLTLDRGEVLIGQLSPEARNDIEIKVCDLCLQYASIRDRWRQVSQDAGVPQAARQGAAQVADVYGRLFDQCVQARAILRQCTLPGP